MKRQALSMCRRRASPLTALFRFVGPRAARHGASGTTTINKIAVQNMAYTSHPTWDLNTKITLIAEGAFALDSAGNILADGGARTVGRAIQLVYDGTNAKWVEVR